MNQSAYRILLIAIAGIFYVPWVSHAQSGDPIGIYWLRTATTNLNGAGIRVAQPEGLLSDPPPAWEVNPAIAGQPTNLFTYSSGSIFTNVFPNALGVESTHADRVGQLFYGIPDGAAMNVAHVDTFDEGTFVNLVNNLKPVNDSVVNQSFTFDVLPVPDQQAADQQYDNYAAQYKTLFVSGAGNVDTVQSPSTCYNGIGVAAYGTVNSSIGPTIDNGRCKPDITAPEYVTSFSTPQVAGSAALLMQAALRGDGGNARKSAFDPRTIKALLLNGAVKPADWTNGSATPLDARYGAGVLNVFNSYKQLIGGRQSYIASTRIASGSAHPPNFKKKTMSVLNGWDFNNITSSGNGNTAKDGVNHYYFNVTNSSGNYLCNATLVWNRQFAKTNINNLDLFLYNCANSNLVACSTSLVDNVEHIFISDLPPGRYDLQVSKAGSTGMVSPTESYALAFAFVVFPTLTVTTSGSDTILSWPAYPAGLSVEASTTPDVPDSWSTDPLPPTAYLNDQNVITLTATGTVWHFRLRQP